jgi:hypothetical protein
MQTATHQALIDGLRIFGQFAVGNTHTADFTVIDIHKFKL